jgi:RNA polymerase sigma-70 factor, ECF subfamily
MPETNEHPDGNEDTGSPRTRIAADYRKWFPLVMRRCLNLLRNEEDALDAAQTVFLNAHRYLTTHSDSTLALNFYFRTATNVSLNMITRDYRKRALEVPIVPEFPGPEPEEGRQQDGRKAITKALSLLDETTQNIIYYIYWDDMAQEEVAALLGINRRTVGRKLKRGKRKMKRFLLSSMAIEPEAESETI